MRLLSGHRGDFQGKTSGVSRAAFMRGSSEPKNTQRHPLPPRCLIPQSPSSPPPLLSAECLCSWRVEAHIKEYRVGGENREELKRSRERERGRKWESKEGLRGRGFDEMREEMLFMFWSRFTASSPFHETSPGGDNHTAADMCTSVRVQVLGVQPYLCTQVCVVCVCVFVVIFAQTCAVVRPYGRLNRRSISKE